jgi:hypothetical protein
VIECLKVKRLSRQCTESEAKQCQSQLKEHLPRRAFGMLTPTCAASRRADVMSRCYGRIRLFVYTGVDHLTMIEIYPEFRRYLLPERERMLARA